MLLVCIHVASNWNKDRLKAPWYADEKGPWCYKIHCYIFFFLVYVFSLHFCYATNLTIIFTDLVILCKYNFIFIFHNRHKRFIVKQAYKDFGRALSQLLSWPVSLSTIKFKFMPLYLLIFWRILHKQVCNPSIQFMIYESSLKYLRAKRTANKSGFKNVTALEVQVSFNTGTAWFFKSI